MDEQNKSSEVVDITKLAGKFSSRKELQDYAEKLFNGLRDALGKIQKLQEENKHLQDMLAKSVPIVGSAVKLEIPNEQAIAELQIARLKETAMSRQLTLDEVKQFDLLTKNLYLSKGKPTSVIKGSSRKIEDEYSEAELVEIIKKNE